MLGCCSLTAAPQLQLRPEPRADGNPAQGQPRRGSRGTGQWDRISTDHSSAPASKPRPALQSKPKGIAALWWGSPESPCWQRHPSALTAGCARHGILPHGLDLCNLITLFFTSLSLQDHLNFQAVQAKPKHLLQHPFPEVSHEGVQGGDKPPQLTGKEKMHNKTTIMK